MYLGQTGKTLLVRADINKKRLLIVKTIISEVHVLKC